MIDTETGIADQSMPLVSVIMNCYNGEAYLREAVESVINQTYKDWELIFWDNQSTDGSREIIRSFKDPRIKYFYAQMHTGLGQARKLAVAQAAGQWIGFIDVDDLWLPDKLTKQVKIINSHNDPVLGLVYGRARIFGENIDKEELDLKYYKRKLPEGDVFRQLLYDNFIAFLTMLVSKDAYNRVGGFSDAFLYAPDYQLSLAVARHYSVGAVQSYIAEYRKHHDNLTKEIKKTDVIIDETTRILLQYADVYPTVRRLIKRKRAIYFINKYVSNMFPYVHRMLTIYKKKYLLFRANLLILKH